MKKADLDAILARNPHIRIAEASAGVGLRPTKHAEPPPALEPDGAGKTPRTGCPLVRFTLRRRRLLDVDAKYGSIKDLLDGLQYAGLIHGDKEGQIRLEVEQVKISKLENQRTVIEIFD